MKYRQTSLGKYSGDSAYNDNPELNRCPDCETLFEGDICPICKKPCPENMKAGNRKPIVEKKEKAVKGATFTPVYFRWWFLLILFVLGLGIPALILFLASDRKKWVKIVAVVLIVLYVLLQVLLFSGLIPRLITEWESKRKTDVSMPEAEYRAACVEISANAFLRDPDAHEKELVRGTYTVVRVNDFAEYGVSYFCTGQDGQYYEIFDCRKMREPRLIGGDTFTAYGRFDCLGFDYTVEKTTLIVYMAFADSFIFAE